MTEPLKATVKATVKGHEFQMIPVSGGSFMMGDQHGDLWDACRPVHQVRVSDFYIGKYPVTQALWKAVMEGRNPSTFQGDDHPVEMVSWDDAQAFMEVLNRITKDTRLEGYHYRLPTEAEWEYAARGGKQSKGYLYAGGDTLNDVAWHRDNSDSKTHSVGGKTPNELGLYDMSGNVWEWCGDWYGDYPSGSQTNPTGPSTGSYRVNRGGNWHLVSRYCRSACRDYYGPDYRNYHFGFRLVYGANTSRKCLLWNGTTR
jgi:formylglycine-generating enzyme required for sulfatase activity